MAVCGKLFFYHYFTLLYIFYYLFIIFIKNETTYCKVMNLQKLQTFFSIFWTKFAINPQLIRNCLKIEREKNYHLEIKAFIDAY